MRAVALMLSVSLLGCFPHNEKYRTYSKYAEGGFILAGIGAEVLANRHTGAACDMMTGQIGYNADCHQTNEVYGGVGLAMILVGLTGFIATISTAEDDKTSEPGPVIIKAQQQPAKPDVKLPPGVTPPPASDTPAAAPTPTGSAAAAPQKPAP